MAVESYRHEAMKQTRMRYRCAPSARSHGAQKASDKPARSCLRRHLLEVAPSKSASLHSCTCRTRVCGGKCFQACACYGDVVTGRMHGHKSMDLCPCQCEMAGTFHLSLCRACQPGLGTCTEHFLPPAGMLINVKVGKVVGRSLQCLSRRLQS